MRTFSEWWSQEGVRNHKAIHAEDWSKAAWVGAMKESSGLAGPVQEAQIEGDPASLEPRGGVWIAAEGKDSGEGTEGA